MKLVQLDFFLFISVRSAFSQVTRIGFVSRHWITKPEATVSAQLPREVVSFVLPEGSPRLIYRRYLVASHLRYFNSTLMN